MHDGIAPHPDSDRSRRCLPQLVATVIPFLVATARGLGEWSAQRNAPLAPDAQWYLHLASSFGPSSFVGGFREPLWPALMAPLTRLLGPVPDAPRLLGVAGFILLVITFQLIVAKLHGRLWGTVAAFLLAMSPWLVFQAARGLREETAAALLLLFGLGITRMGVRGRFVVSLAILAGLTAMLRWDTLLISLPVLAVGLTVHRAGARYWVLSVVVVFAVVSPLVLGNWAINGDPMYQSNVHARFFRNLEFAGKPGFPTLEEVSVDSFAGPSITWTGYLFGLHEPLQLAERTVAGMGRVPYSEAYRSVFYPSAGIGPGDMSSPLRYSRLAISVTIVLIGAAGGLLLLLSPNWPLGTILFISMFEFAPIGEIFDPRLALTCIPFLFLGNLELLAVLADQQRREAVAARLRTMCDAVRRARWLMGRLPGQSGAN